MDDKRTIRINLDQVSNPTSTPHGDGFLQVGARRRVLSALVNFDKPAQESEDKCSRPRELNIIKDRRHDAILVSARRGEGKTTFLTNILESIQDGSYRELLSEGNSQVNAKLPNLYSLGIIDPTLIESKQNIMVVVIDRIRIATVHHHRHHNSTSDDYALVKKSLRKLAQGLSLLDGIGGSLYAGREWMDPDFVLDQGLVNASAAHDFEQSFRDFVNRAASYLGCDAFVLAIDDVDTWFEKGWPVLEALRKYLVTPQLRIILSGDMNLYSLLIRRQQWAQMDKDFLAAEQMRAKAEPETSQIKQIGRMVDALQDQYLVKVAPPENRIELRPLEYHLRHARLELFSGRLTKPMAEVDFVDRMAARLLGLTARADIDLFRYQLLNLPTRSSLQALAGAVELNDDRSGQDPDASRAIETLRHIAWTSLMGLGIDIEATRDPSPALILGNLGQWLTQTGRWLDLARFHPDLTDQDRNLVAIYLAAVLVDIFRESPGRMLEFWLKISTIREKIDRHEVGEEGANSIQRLMDHLNAHTVESAVQFVSRLAAWEVVEGGRGQTRIIMASIRLSGATIPLGRIRETKAAALELYGLEYAASGKKVLPRELFRRSSKATPEYRKDLLKALPAPLRGYHAALMDAGWSYDSRRGIEAGFQKYFANGIEDLAAKLDRNGRVIALLPVSRIVSGQSAEHGNYSFLRLLAAIAELLDIPREEDSHKREQRIAQVVDALAQARSYPTPYAVSSEGKVGDAEFEQEDDPEPGQTDGKSHAIDESSVERVISQWLDVHKLHDVALAPITLSRMWTRFTYTFSNVRDELVHGESRYLGVLFHRTAIAFLHAVGFEALRAANLSKGGSLAKNPVKSGEVFVSLLDEIYENDQLGFKKTPEFAVFDAIFSCPLWAFFLARTEEEEVLTPRRSRPNDKIFKHYNDRVAQYRSDSADLAAVKLTSPKTGEGPAEFQSLFFLLNTVQLQGGGNINARAGDAMAAFKEQLKPSRTSKQPLPEQPEGGDDGEPN